MTLITQMEVDYMKMGNVIKKYRTLHEMTQEELASILAVTPQAVSRWENNLSYPDVAMIPEIMNVLNVSADELFEPGKYLNLHSPDFALVPLDMLGKLSLLKDDEMAEEYLNQDQVDCLFGDSTKTDGSLKTVLIIDDSAFMRNMVSDILGSKGHIVLQAESGEAGLEELQHRAASSNQIDICVLDIRMPDMNGIDTLKQIRNLYETVKIVMLSAASSRANVEMAKELGAVAFIAKPFQAERLVEKV